MQQLFLKLFNLSLSAGILILAVLIIRKLFEKAPKWIICLLWGIVAIRLICPFSLESALSLAPRAEVVRMDASETRPVIQSGFEGVDTRINTYVANLYVTEPMPALPETSVEAPAVTKRPVDVVGILSRIWLAGVILLFAYGVFSYARVYKSVRISIRSEKNVYLCDDIKMPFILGVVNPRIYLPSDLTEDEKANILAHEQAHIKRGDFLWKLLGFLLLTVYWFQPLIWVAYIMLCRDIEMACDEKVIANMSAEQKKQYSMVLLSFSAPNKMITACPLAFGEAGVKERVKGVMNYRKPAFWVILAALVVCVAVMICFLTNSKGKENGEDIVGYHTPEESAVEETIPEPQKDASQTNPVDDHFTDIGEELPTTSADLLQDNHDAALANIARVWANAFCERDGFVIGNIVSDDLRKRMLESEILTEENGQYAFGYSSPWPMQENAYVVTKLDSDASAIEILYYAMTSDPTVTVWREIIQVKKEGGAEVIDEELTQFDCIETTEDFEAAYPKINNTWMDYTKNGLAPYLYQTAQLSSSYLLANLQNPSSAAKLLLHLADNENIVDTAYYVPEDDGYRIEQNLAAYDYSEQDEVIVLVALRGSSIYREIKMVKLKEYGDIWVPQDMTSAEDTFAEMAQRKANNSVWYWYTNRDYPFKTWKEVRAVKKNMEWWREVSNPPVDLLAQFTTEELAHLALAYPIMPYMPTYTDPEADLFCSTLTGYSTIWDALMQREDRTMAILQEYAVNSIDAKVFESFAFMEDASVWRVMVTEFYVLAYSKSFTEEERLYYSEIVEEKKKSEYAGLEQFHYGLSFHPDGSAYREYDENLTAPSWNMEEYDTAFYLKAYHADTEEFEIQPVIFVDTGDAAAVKKYGLQNADLSPSYIVVDDDEKTETLSLAKDVTFQVINWKRQQRVVEKSVRCNKDGYICVLNDAGFFFDYMKEEYGDRLEQYPMMLRLNASGEIAEVYELWLP